MLSGAATWASSGADLDLALTSGSIREYLSQARAASGALHLNLGLWIVGVVLMCAGGCQLALLGRARAQLSTLACFVYGVGAAVGIVAFSLWLGIVKGLAPAEAGAEVDAMAVALGQAATIADWIATVLILSVGSILVARAGKGIWVPGWLGAWAMLVGLAGVLALIGLFVGQRSTYAMLVVPAGVGWLIAAGVTAGLRSAETSRDSRPDASPPS